MASYIHAKKSKKRYTTSVFLLAFLIPVLWVILPLFILMFSTPGYDIASPLSFLTDFQSLSSLSIFLVIIACAFALVSAAVAFVILLRALGDTKKILLKGVSLSATTKQIREKVNNLASSLGLSNLEIHMTNSPLICCFPQKDSNVLILSEPIVEKLDEDELDAVLLHELCHAKYDWKGEIELQIIRMLNIRMLAYSLVAIIITVPFAWGVHANFNFGWEVGVVAAVLLAVGIFLGLLAHRPQKTGHSIAGNYIYVREIFADCFCYLHTRNPGVLESALRKVIMLSFKFPRLPVTALNFTPYKDTGVSATDENIFAIKYDSWKTAGQFLIGRLQATEVCPLSYRLKILKLLDRLINSSISLKVGKSKSDQEIMWMLEFLELPASINLQKMKLFLVYTKDNLSDFNLIKCSSHLGIDPFHVFLIFFVFVSHGLIKIEN